MCIYLDVYIFDKSLSHDPMALKVKGYKQNKHETKIPPYEKQIFNTRTM